MGIFRDKDKKESKEVYLGDLKLRCQICKEELFWRREAQLNTATATAWGLDYLNASADCYVCARCGYIHWFLPQEEGQEHIERRRKIFNELKDPCPYCKFNLKSGKDKCDECGKEFYGTA